MLIEKAKALLHERYGNCNVISTAFIEKLEKWPKINQKDHSALRDFSDFLEKIIPARETIPSLAILDFAKENVKLLAKLPYHLENKWRDHIKQWRVSHGEISYPPFKRFAEFIKDAADKANIPELKGLVQLKDSKRENYSSITSQAKLAKHSSANSFCYSS